jgi:hypothetical protein
MSRRGHSGDILSQQLSHGVLIPGHGIPLCLQKITHWRDVITRLQQAKGLQPAWHFSPPILSVVKTRRFTSQTLPLARRQTGVLLHKFHKLRPLECLFLFSLSNDAGARPLGAAGTAASLHSHARCAGTKGCGKRRQKRKRSLPAKEYRI